MTIWVNSASLNWNLEIMINQRQEDNIEKSILACIKTIKIHLKVSCSIIKCWENCLQQRTVWLGPEHENSHFLPHVNQYRRMRWLMMMMTLNWVKSLKFPLWPHQLLQSKNLPMWPFYLKAIKTYSNGQLIRRAIGPPSPGSLLKTKA